MVAPHRALLSPAPRLDRRLASLRPLATPSAINLLAVSLGGLVLAILVAVFALVRIWFGGQLGAGSAFGAIFIAVLGLALPLILHVAGLLPAAPQRHRDDAVAARSQFKQLAAMRPADSNRIEGPDAAKGEAQKAAYPDIRPMELERSTTETFDMVHEAVKRLGWTVVRGGGAEPGWARPHRGNGPDFAHGLHR